MAHTCAEVPAAVRTHVALCLELPNANGREAHTMAKFVGDHYNALPRFTYFAQARARPRRR